VKEVTMTDSSVPTPQPDDHAGATDPELDTEGHSLLGAQLADTMNRERVREVDREALAAARRRELPRTNRSLRSRLLGR
jgi:hypothetical protein